MAQQQRGAGDESLCRVDAVFGTAAIDCRSQGPLVQRRGIDRRFDLRGDDPDEQITEEVRGPRLGFTDRSGEVRSSFPTTTKHRGVHTDDLAELLEADRRRAEFRLNSAEQFHGHGDSFPQNKQSVIFWQLDTHAAATVLA